MGAFPDPRTRSRRRRRWRSAALIAVALSLACAPGAFADAFTQVYQNYRKHGSVQPCAFSEQTLQQAEQEVPPDIDQYAPDFPAAIEAALQARARGACSPQAGTTSTSAAVAPPVAAPPRGPTHGRHHHASRSAVPAPPAAARSASALPISFAPARSSTGSGPPAPVVAIAALAAILALAALVWGYGRWRGFESRWMLGAGHALSEAGYRLEATWADFTDWVRFGR
jgi:hypothetical protein